MPLTEEEKQALKKKYREQRQAIWTGKPSSRLPSQDASKVEEIEVSSDEDAPDVSAETALPRRGDPSSSSAQTDVERNESQKVKTDSPQVRDRVQVQSEDKWQEQRGETSQNEESLWNSSDEKKGSIMLTWKLALGVVGTIIVLVGIGVLLGYWFAS